MKRSSVEERIDGMEKWVQRLISNLDKVYSLLDTALTSVFRLGSSMLLARFAGAEVFAQYVLFITALVITQSLSQNFFTTPVIHSAGLSRQKIGGLFHWSTRRLGFFQLFLVFLVFGGWAISHLWKWGEFSTMAGFAISGIVYVSVQHCRAFRQTRFENKRLLVASSSGMVIHTIVFLFTWRITEAPMFAYGWALLANHTLVYLLIRAKNLNTDEGKSDLPVLDPRELKQIQRNGKFMTLGSLAGIFSSRLQPFALATFANSLAVAQFGAVMVIAGPVRMSSMFLQNILRPRLAMYHNRGDASKFNRIAQLAIFLLVLFGGVATLTSYFIEQYLLEICFGLNDSFPTGILAIAFMYATIDSVTSCQMLVVQISSENGSAIATRIRFFSAVLSCVVVIPLCVSFGALGALISLLSGEVLYVILASIHRRKMRYHRKADEVVSPQIVILQSSF